MENSGAWWAAFGLGLAVGLATLAVALLWQRRNHRRLMQSLNRMLDAALNQQQALDTFDETMLSQVESKLYRLVNQSVLSAQTIGGERDKIKTLISDISHQTKTPIANILLYSQLLAEQDGLPEEAAGLAKEVREQGEKLSFLIQSLVKTSRLETHIIQVRPERQAVLPLLEKLAGEYQAKAKAKQVTLTYQCGADITARFDFKWTLEAVGNLLDNAVKYTPAQGGVSLRAEAYEMFTKIEVADNGIGIAEAEINQVFQRFYRGQAVQAQEGVGIGLYLAREIITAQGGYIRVHSQVGKGSVFAVFLPRQSREI